MAREPMSIAARKFAKLLATNSTWRRVVRQFACRPARLGQMVWRLDLHARRSRDVRVPLTRLAEGCFCLAPMAKPGWLRRTSTARYEQLRTPVVHCRCSRHALLLGLPVLASSSSTPSVSSRAASNLHRRTFLLRRDARHEGAWQRGGSGGVCERARQGQGTVVARVRRG